MSMEDVERNDLARVIYDRTGMDLEKCHEVAQECLAAGFHRDPRWTAVTERLPEENRNVLWCRVPVTEPYVVASMMDDLFDDHEFTHWMPIPLPPAPAAKAREEAGPT